MSVRRDLGRIIGTWLALGALTLAGCTKSHDVDKTNQPLGDAGRPAGRGGAGGLIATGMAGSAGTSGTVVAPAGMMELECGTCAGASVLGFLNLPPCCAADDKCGLEFSSLGAPGCVESDSPGELDANCPEQSLMGLLTFMGCCRPDGTCGALDTLLGSGCTNALAAADAPAVSCTPQ